MGHTSEYEVENIFIDRLEGIGYSFIKMDTYDDVAVVGDAVAPRKILTAVHEGYHAIRVME